jgi:uncharacterized protein YciW
MQHSPANPAAYDWLSPTDAVRLALAAYYGACRLADRDAADADGVSDPDASRLCLAERLAQIFEFKVLAHGHGAGIERFPADIDKYLSRQLEDTQSLEFRDTQPNTHRAQSHNESRR